MSDENDKTSEWVLPNGKRAVSHGDWMCEACGHQHVAGLGGICVGCPCEETAPPTSGRPPKKRER